MSTAVATAVATLLATVITVTVGYLTKRAATKANERNTATLSRTDMERDAFVRADAITAGAMKRLQDENREQEVKIDRLEAKLDEQAVEIAELRRQLDIANRTLRLRYPDE